MHKRKRLWGKKKILIMAQKDYEEAVNVSENF